MGVHLLNGIFEHRLFKVSAGRQPVYCSIEEDNLGEDSRRSYIVMEKLGDYSYGMYLLHVPVIIFVS